MTRKGTLLVAVAVALLGAAVGLVVDLVDDEGSATTGAAHEAGVVPDRPCTVALTVSDPAFEGGGQYFVATVDPDGTVRRVSGTDVAHDPAISPDGTRIAYIWADEGYESAGPTQTAVWTMGIDGADPRPVADDAAWHASPSWSPDGRRIAFGRTVATGDDDRTEELVVAAPDGSGATVVARIGDGDDGHITAVDWSPDGTRLAYLWFPVELGVEPGPVELRTVPVEGGPTEVVAVLPLGSTVDWSADGASFLVTTREGPRPSLRVVDAATGDERGALEGVVLARGTADGDHAYVVRSAGEREQRRWELARVPFPPDASAEGRVVARVADPAGDMSIGPGC